ncbi:MAG: DGQHR domain-containing protein [Saprospiraceae bacterium]|nr:DGQHR domain-containing protein [Saprospiraceae bacterium]
MNQLILPSLKGKFGSWVYFIVTMKLSDVANKSRISIVTEIEELYSKNINDVLQRDLDNKRINKIAEYLQNQSERFLSSLIVAIFKGSPIWSEIRIEDNFEIEKKEIESEKLQYARGRLGFLTLNGDESMFVLDGQHRLKGIREAYKRNSELVKGDDIMLTLVVHQSQFKERTRRLFTVLNRYAEKPKKAELIIMEEDDAAAILTRRLLLNHPIFKKENSIAKGKGAAIAASDQKSFTTILCLYDIVKELIDFKSIYPKSSMIKRLSEDKLEDLYENKVLPYWEYFFQSFPSVEKYIDGKIADKNFLRNKDNGGSLLLRPEGQLILASLYKHFESLGRKQFVAFKKRLPKMNFQLSSPLLKYLFWTGEKMNTKNKALKRKSFLYQLGANVDATLLKKEYTALYNEYNDEFKTTLRVIQE